MTWRCERCSWEGDGADLADGELKGKPVLGCPRCGPRTRVKILRPRFRSAASTSEKTVLNYPWVRPRVSRCIDEPDMTWVFVDGASSGSYAAVVFEPPLDVPGESLATLGVEHVRHGEPNAARNVSAELMAVALGLKNVRRGSNVILVADFLGTACWFMGVWTVGCSLTVARLRVIGRLLEDRDLVVDFVHTRGHLKDDSDFTRFNNRADALCAERPGRRGR